LLYKRARGITAPPEEDDEVGDAADADDDDANSPTIHSRGNMDARTCDLIDELSKMSLDASAEVPPPTKGTSTQTALPAVSKTAPTPQQLTRSALNAQAHATNNVQQGPQPRSRHERKMPAETLALFIDTHLGDEPRSSSAGRQPVARDNVLNEQSLVDTGASRGEDQQDGAIAAEKGSEPSSELPTHNRLID